MKAIHKQSEPIVFAEWKAANPDATYNDLCNGDTSAINAKRGLKDSLLIEQKYICCYCECRISESNSHIEHFRPKDPKMFPQLQLDYNNLFASCTKTPTGTQDEHCGHRKSNIFTPDLVSPLESDCSSHFAYMLDGSITGKDQRGKETVRILHLDSAQLTAQRKLLIDSFLDVNEDELQTEIDNHLEENVKQLGEFFTMIEYLSSSGQL